MLCREGGGREERLCTAVDVWPRLGVGEADGGTLENAGVFQGILQYGLLDSGEDESDIRCVGGLCKTVQVSGALATADRVRTEGIS
jgi:hypothetical protein